MKTVLNRIISPANRGNLGASLITRAMLAYHSENGRIITSMVLAFIFISMAGDPVFAQGSVETATRNLSEGFSKLLGIIFGPIRWIISVVGILIGLWHIFAGSRPDSRRTGTWVIVGVLAYAFAPTIVSFVFSIAGNQTFRQTEMNQITVGQ